MANGCAKVRSGEVMVSMPVPTLNDLVVYSQYQLSPTLKYFKFDHLPPKLQEVSRPFAELAEQVARRAPYSPETEVALRKLLESKDAAVRAALDSN
jgi:hypothetical protein